MVTATAIHTHTQQAYPSRGFSKQQSVVKAAGAICSGGEIIGSEVIHGSAAPPHGHTEELHASGSTGAGLTGQEAGPANQMPDLKGGRNRRGKLIACPSPHKGTG